jgi:hypothetical protein
LNVKRATERRKPQEITIVNQKFDPKQFNFTKIKSDEVLFELEKEETKAICNGNTTKVWIISVYSSEIKGQGSCCFGPSVSLPATSTLVITFVRHKIKDCLHVHDQMKDSGVNHVKVKFINVQVEASKIQHGQTVRHSASQIHR